MRKIHSKYKLVFSGLKKKSIHTLKERHNIRKCVAHGDKNMQPSLFYTHTHTHTHWPKEMYATPSELHVSESCPNGLSSGRQIAPIITSGMLPIFPVPVKKRGLRYSASKFF
jgi:hypothetical protein